MKRILAVLATIVISLAFGLAFADEMVPMENREIGALLFEEAPTAMVKETVASVPVEEVARDLGAELYETYLAHEKELASPRGIAAGGLGAEHAGKELDDNTKIWDALLTPSRVDFP
jgi:hypothetical protein